MLSRCARLILPLAGLPQVAALVTVLYAHAIMSPIIAGLMELVLIPVKTVTSRNLDTMLTPLSLINWVVLHIIARSLGPSDDVG